MASRGKLRERERERERAKSEEARKSESKRVRKSWERRRDWPTGERQGQVVVAVTAAAVEERGGKPSAERRTGDRAAISVRSSVRWLQVMHLNMHTRLFS